MSQERKLVTKRTAILAGIIGVVLVGGLAAALIYALTKDKGEDVVVTPPSGGSGYQIETVSASGGSFESDADARLRISLSKGQQEAGEVEAAPLAEGEPLSESEIEAILNRLPELTGESGDVVDFNLPERSLPPPRTGEVVDEPFPPPPSDAAPPEVAEGPLEVLRYAPEGEISIAPFMNVTFNQPMVPLTTIEELSALEVPVIMTPEIPGVWKWLGTKTLSFEYQSEEIDRFPKATEYQIVIPAGTTSMVGGVLEQDFSWNFKTPPPTLTNYYPSDGPQPLEPVIFIAFDQQINADAAFSSIKLEIDGNAQPIRMATAEEIEADKVVSRMVENTHDGYWLAVRATQPLPTDTSVVIRIEAGMSSAEGPLTTTEQQQFSFYTYAPLQITDHECGWYDGECPPLMPFYIYFNNPLDVDSFNDTMISIDPEIPGAAISLSGRSLTIQGLTQGRTTYDVTISGSIKDVFGQTMGRDETVRFKVGSAPPSLSGPDQILVTLDPSSEKQIFTVYSINYDKLWVRAYAVEPSDWPDYKEFLRQYYRDQKPPPPPGTEVFDDEIDIDHEKDVLTETAIDLEEIIQGDYGHVIVIVSPPKRLFRSEDHYRDIVAWVQSTKIGLDAFVDHSEMVVWATGLDDGAPTFGVDVSSIPAGISVQTGEDGLGQMDLNNQGISLLVGRKGDDTAILPASTYYWGDDSWSKRPVYDELRWYIFDDRQMYRPGEEVHVKGWMRRIGGLQGGDVQLLGSSAQRVIYRVMGPQGNELTSGEAEVNALGGFDFVFTLPTNANLGYANLVLTAQGDLRNLDSIETYHQFQIQEFRRPEFEVSARTESVGPYFVGEHAVVAVEAKYYAGGPLPNAETTWYVSSTPTNYSPPNWSDFNFGVWRPWWLFYYEDEYYYDPYYEEFDDGTFQTFEGFTDPTGTHYLRIDFDEATKPRPYSVAAEATVMDVNRQAWSDSTSLLVHPSAYYVGIRSEKYFVQQGTPLEIEAIVTDIDGKAISGQTFTVTAGRLEWKYQNGRWDEIEADVQECIKESSSEPVTCTFDTSSGGTYRITATVTDELGRQNKSEFQRWVSGGQQPPARNVEQETVSLIPDKEIYNPGDTAQILVQSPFSPAEGLLTVSRNGLLYTKRFLMSEGTTTLEIPIDEEHIPNLNIQVDLVGSAPRTSDVGEIIEDIPPRPAYATGSLNLGISALSRSLTVELEPEDTALEPGGETVLHVTATDADGRPVTGAELAVVVVDEAILALTDYYLYDPLYTFYSDRPSWMSSQYGRASIVLANPQLLAEQVEAGAADSAAIREGEVVYEMAVEEEVAMEPSMAPSPTGTPQSQEAQTIQVRTDFNPLATFAPEVRTNANGQAEVEIQLPDNLTRYRIMVVAVSGDKQFGSAESNLVARLPLMVRPSAPRFLNFGDRFELPIVLQNQTNEVMEVDVVVEATNIELSGDQGLRVQVPANDRIEVRFPMATMNPGTARFQIAAVSGQYADAATVDLPVYTPATTEAFATYGVVDEGAVVQPVLAPLNVYPQFGGLEINTSSTALQALTDAVLYLTAYPYECTEQMASRILAIAALRDVLTAFEADGLPSPEEMEMAVERDIEMLSNLQNYDGGFPVWTRGKDSIPFHSIHVAHALQMAESKGFDVPQDMQEAVLYFLVDIEDYYPSWYGQRTRWNMSAYALYVRMLMGDRDAPKASALYQEAGLDGLSLEGDAWLWRVLNDDPSYNTEVEEIERHIQNRAVETPGAANFTTDYGEEAYLLLHSDRRTDAIILDALMAGDPESDLIPKVVNGLLAHRTKGRWGNTQENVFVLLALDRYFNTFEAETPDFVARMWLGETFAGEHEFVGRSTDRVQTLIPMTYLTEEPGQPGETYDLILSKDGVGRLYYRLGMSYSPVDLELDPLDMGFVVKREYEWVDDPEDVYRDTDGVWHIRAGARVRVRLTMVADNRRYHVALVDPLPAGLEIVNPALAVSGEVPEDPADSVSPWGYWRWWWTWFEHQNMRDERAEAFTTLLWDGVHNYSYVARATTPGEFVVPPAKAEEMYSPEVFGRSASDFVVIE